jgi:MFS transporter, DHA1 family, multidrug resistance protein
VNRAEARATLLGLLLAAGVFNLAYTMLVPLVAVLRGRFSMGPLAVGLAFGGFALTKALFQPVGGLVVDRFRPLPTVVCGLLFVAVSLLGLAVARSGSEVIGWRLVWGASEGLVMPGFYRLATLTGRETGHGEAAVMGWFGSAAVFGMAGGALTTGLLYRALGFRGTFMVGTLFALASAVVAGVALRPVVRSAGSEPARTASRTPTATEDGWGSATKAGSRGAWQAVLPLAVFVGVLDAANNALYGGIEPILPLRVAELVRNPVIATSLLFFVGLLVFGAASGLLARLMQRLDARPPTLVSFLIATPALLVLGFSPWLIVVGIAMVVFVITQPVVYIATRKSLAGLPESLQGRAFGVFGMVSDVGFVVGPLLTSLIWDRFGSLAFVALAGASLLAAAATGAWPVTLRPAREGVAA